MFIGIIDIVLQNHSRHKFHPKKVSILCMETKVFNGNFSLSLYTLISSQLITYDE